MRRVLLLLALSCLAFAPVPPPRPDPVPAPTPSSDYVIYTLEGESVRYFLLDDGMIYPGVLRDGEAVVWRRAQPLLLSQYAFGGPHSRMPLLVARRGRFTVGPTPASLKRTSHPK